MNALCKLETSSFSGLYNIYRQDKCSMIELEVLATYTPLRNLCICEMGPYKNDMSLNKTSKSQKFSE